jgi:hypothetical protein
VRFIEGSDFCLSSVPANERSANLVNSINLKGPLNHKKLGLVASTWTKMAISLGLVIFFQR